MRKPFYEEAKGSVFGRNKAVSGTEVQINSLLNRRSGVDSTAAAFRFLRTFGIVVQDQRYLSLPL